MADIYPLSRLNDMQQSALVFDSEGSVPDGDGAGQDGLNAGGVKVHHHGFWQVEHLLQPQEVHPLLRLLCEAQFRPQCLYI